MIEGSDFAQKQLNTDMKEALNEVLSAEDAQAGRGLEQLSEESAWKLEYSFEEIDVAVGEQVADLEEDEEMHDNDGSIVKSVGVPARHFWIMALGLVFSTLMIFLLLRSLLQQKEDKKFADMDLDEDEDEFWVVPPVMEFLARAFVDKKFADMDLDEDE